MSAPFYASAARAIVAAEPTSDAREIAIAQGFSDEICDRCGGSHLLRSGTCLTCQDCGATTGCS